MLVSSRVIAVRFTFLCCSPSAPSNPNQAPPMPTPLTFVTESITPPPPRPPQPSPVNRLGMSKFRSNVFRPYQPGPTSTSPPVPSAQSKGGNFPVSETQRPPANRPSMIGSPTSLSNYHSSDGHKRQDQPPYATSPPNLSAQASNSKSRISSRDKQLDTLYLSSSKETYSNLQGQLEIVPQTQRRTAHGR